MNRFIAVLIKLELMKQQQVEELRKEADEVISIVISPIKTARKNSRT